jgi:hypothetical protein
MGEYGAAYEIPKLAERPFKGGPWDKKNLVLGAVVATTAALFSVVAGPSWAGASTASHPITWLAAGDSYSSDVGLPYTTHICGRAVPPSVDWATYAWTKLQSSLNVVKPDLVACQDGKDPLDLDQRG